jgi:hypothetical protein
MGAFDLAAITAFAVIVLAIIQWVRRLLAEVENDVAVWAAQIDRARLQAMRGARLRHTFQRRWKIRRRMTRR